MASSPPSKRKPLSDENLVLLLALVPYVVDRGEVRVQEAARQFDRSEADIRKAVELIACAGIPGESTFYLHADLFDIDWDLFEREDIIRFEHTVVIEQQPAFSSREWAALLAGLQYLSIHPAYQDRTDVASLLERLGDALGDEVVPHVHVRSSAAVETGREVQEAISAGRQVTFRYVGRDGNAEDRIVDPLSLGAVDDVWYLRGWCHTREALRTFRLDRISDLAVTDRAVSGLHEADSADQWTVFQPAEKTLRVTIQFPERVLPLITEYLDRGTAPRREGDTLIADVSFAHEGALVRLICSHPGQVTVIAPESARRQVESWANAGLEAAGDI